MPELRLGLKPSDSWSSAPALPVTDGRSLCVSWPHCCTLADPGRQTTEVAILALLANGLELARPVLPALCLILASPEFHQASEHFHFLLHILPDSPPYSW